MKSISFSLILALLCYLTIEVFSYAAYRVTFGSYNLHDIHQKKLTAIAALDSGGVFVPIAEENVIMKSILHPYLGYVTDGKLRKPNCTSNVIEECYSRIRVPTDLPMFKKSGDKLIIGILGGSVAEGVARVSDKTIAREFSKSGLYDNRKIEVHNLAGGGYKQPQQLMNLAYYYALGAEFDVIINIDGFNEMAVSHLGYRDRGLHPAFPGHWSSRVASLQNIEYIDVLSDKRSAQKDHIARTKALTTAVVRHSPLLNFIWQIFDQRHSLKVVAFEQQIAGIGKTSNRDFSYQAVGPDVNFTDWDAFHAQIAQLWADSSIAISALAKGRGASYYHFLQPNQYIDGNKILSPIEKSEFVLAGGSYGNIWQITRDTIIEHAAQLDPAGVYFRDLSFIFKDESATLYVDNCCHLNGKGYDLMSAHISRLIISEIKRVKASTQDAPLD